LFDTTIFPRFFINQDGDLSDTFEKSSNVLPFEFLNTNSTKTVPIYQNIDNAVLANIDNNTYSVYYNNGIGSLGSESNVYLQTGLFDHTILQEQSTLNKTNAYYIDESIVSFNSPDLISSGNILNDSEAFNFDLIGAILVDNTYGTYEAITSTPGVNAFAQVLNTRNKTEFANADALTNAPLYQDEPINLVWKSDTELQSKIIKASNLSTLYKAFLWNRETSLSCFINSNIGIQNPLYIASEDETDDTIETLSYIPAKPLKKVFANIRVSNNTQYLGIETQNIECPKYFNYEDKALTLFTYNKQQKVYYGNVDEIATIPNGDGYVLLDDKNKAMWEDKNGSTSILDPIHI